MAPDENPYESPTAPPSEISPEPVVSADETKLARYAQMLLRVLGVFFLVDGSSGLVGGTAYFAMQGPAFERDGLDVFRDTYVIWWFAGSAVLFAAGLYLVIGGRWLIETVFLSSSRTPDGE